MKRRDFVVRSAGAALLTAMPMAALAATRGALLDDPQAWLGARFRTGQGSLLELADVERLAGDRHTTQWRLGFRMIAGAAPNEGTHVLTCGSCEDALFLQRGLKGPVACINRLHTLS